jgi:integrase/recombinase XerD
MGGKQPYYMTEATMSIALVSSTWRMIKASSREAEALSFMHWLKEERYRDDAIDRHLRRFLFVLSALDRHRGADDRFTQHVLQAVFLTGRRGSVRRYLYAATRRVYSRYLLSQGRLRLPPPSGLELMLLTYDRYLLEVRGLSASSRYQHAHTIRLLLKGFEAEIDLKKLNHEAIERFVRKRSETLSRHSMQHTVAHVRAFLRYAHDSGLTDKRLDTIDTPRTYRGELPPRAMPWPMVMKLLSSIDLKSRCGRRDLCVLHLVAHYGLRPSEVVGLKVSSIDFDRSILKVDQRKTRATLTLPLHRSTLKLLSAYLRDERSRRAIEFDSLFLKDRCPYGPLGKYGVGDLFRKRMQEAKLPDHLKNVYRLRHTLAMRLLTRGVGIKAIGDVLGHRSFYGTSAYLRLDMGMLRDVALDVPTAGGQHG